MDKMEICRIGYRKKGQKTWHPMTVNLVGKRCQEVWETWKKVPKNRYPTYGLPEDAIISRKPVKRIRR